MRKFLNALMVIVYMLGTTSLEAAETKQIKANGCPIVNCQNCTQFPKSIDNLSGNFNNEVKIIFSDIDGTILPFEKDVTKLKVPKSAVNAIKKLHKAKLPLVLTTGRVYCEAKEMAHKLGNDKAYIITNQGAEVRNPKGELIYKDTIDCRDAFEIINCIDKIVKENNFDSKIIVFNNGKLYSMEKFKLDYIWAPVNVINSFNDLGDDVSPSEIVVYDMKTKDLKVIQSQLKAKFFNYHIDLSTHCFCNVTSATATKGNAISKLSTMLNVDLKNAATFGDGENDSSMLKQVKKSGGLSIAVDNAMDSLKENSNFATTSVYDGGFAKGVDSILSNNSKLKK